MLKRESEVVYECAKCKARNKVDKSAIKRIEIKHVKAIGILTKEAREISEMKFEKFKAK